MGSLEAGAIRVLQTKTIILSRIKTNPAAFDKRVLHQKYVVERHSMRQIAAEFSSSKARVRRALVAFAIPLRERWRNPYRRHNLLYGKRYGKGKLVDHPAEQKVIALILRMHDEKISNSAIARVLTQMGTPTKTKMRTWHYETVRRILLAYGNKSAVFPCVSF